jgi:hypothetical protein
LRTRWEYERDEYDHRRDPDRGREEEPEVCEQQQSSSAYCDHGRD